MARKVLMSIGGVLITVNLVLMGVYAIRYKPQPHEVLADFVQQLSWDGSVMRMDFARTDIAPTNSAAPGPTDRQTVARVTLTRAAEEQLFRNLARIHGVRLEEQPSPAPTPPEPAPKPL